MEPLPIPSDLLHYPPLARVVLCVAHYTRCLEYSLSPEVRLRVWVRTFVYLCLTGGMAVLLSTGALYAVLFLAGIVLAIAGVILAIAKTLLGVMLCLLGVWIAGQVLLALIREENHKRKRRY